MFGLPLWLVLAMVVTAVWAVAQAAGGVVGNNKAMLADPVVLIPDSRQDNYTLAELWASRK